MAKIKFRTKYEAGSFNDNEVYEEGTSLTEPGQAESMQSLLSRMTRPVGRPVSDAVSLKDDEIDVLMSDADLDEAETEKTEMAQAIETYVQASELLADAGANSASESEAGVKPDKAKTTANETQANSQTPASGFATEPEQTALA